MSAKILNSLRKEISTRERELQGLIEAFNLLSGSVSGRGRKSSITSTISSLLGSGNSAKGKKKGTGKRGRPAGSKNKPNAKKPGPKPSKKLTSQEKTSSNNKGSKAGAGKPKGKVIKSVGRPKKSTVKRGRPKSKGITLPFQAISEN